MLLYFIGMVEALTKHTYEHTDFPTNLTRLCSSGNGDDFANSYETFCRDIIALKRTNHSHYTSGCWNYSRRVLISSRYWLRFERARWLLIASVRKAVESFLLHRIGPFVLCVMLMWRRRCRRHHLKIKEQRNLAHSVFICVILMCMKMGPCVSRVTHALSVS